MSTKKNKGSFIGLVPLILFLIIYMATGLITNDFGSMPLLIGIFIACVIAVAIPKKGDNKTTFSDKIDIFCKGGGESTLIMMVLIFILAGGFGGVAKAMGASDSLTNLGLSILPNNLVLPGLFLIGCLLSFAMGTSMGTVATLMPVGIEIATKTNVNVALVAGAIVGGAMFGDNLSFISDTVIGAVRTQKVAMKDKFIYNIIIVLPAIVLNVFFLAFVKVDTTALASASYDWNFVNLIPYIVVIVASLAGLNVMIVFLISIVAGAGIGIMNGSFNLIESFGVIHQGMMGMEDVAIIAIFVGGLVAIMTYLGGIDWLVNTLSKSTKSRAGGELSIASLVMLLCIATTNNTIAVIATGPLARTIGKKFKIPRVRVATILSLFCCSIQGLLPHAGQLLVAGGLAGISPVSIMPYVWYCLLMTLFGILAIVFNFPKTKYTEENGYDHFDESDASVEEVDEMLEGSIPEGNA